MKKPNIKQPQVQSENFKPIQGFSPGGTTSEISTDNEGRVMVGKPRKNPFVSSAQNTINFEPERSTASNPQPNIKQQNADALKKMRQNSASSSY